MNMAPPSSSTHSSSGPSSMIPAPPMPRPPNASGPGASMMPGHPGPIPGAHPAMNPAYGHMSAHHYPQNQSHPMGGGPNNGPPSYQSMTSSSPSARSLSGGPGPSVPGGPSSGMHPSHSHAHSHGAAPSPYHHPLHSPSGMRQSSHHHQQMPPSHHQHMHPMHPPPQHHHSNMPPHQPPPHHQQYQHYTHQHPPQHSSHHMMPQSSSASSIASSQQPPPPSQQPPMYLTNSINGNWQSDRDMNHRREMIQNIVQLLKQRDKNSSTEWLNKLPQMVKQLEVSLYRSAPSFEAYADKSTLKHRLQLLAMEIAKKTHGGDEHGNTNGVGDKNNHDQSIHNNRDNSRRNDLQAGASRSNSRGGGYPPLPHTETSSSGPPQPPPRAPQAPDYHRGQMNTPPDVRGGMRMDQPPSHPPWPQHPPPPLRNGDHLSMHKIDSSSSSTVVNLGQINGMMNVPNDVVPSRGSTSIAKSSSLSINGPSSANNSKSSEKESDMRIRHKQQRLLLLHHSSKCQNADGKCPVTQHCADMKRLWLHMAKCEDNRCRVPHCYSSRAILSHYRKCKDAECQACAPVREVVFKHRSRSSPTGSSRPQSNGQFPSGGGSGGGVQSSPPSSSSKPLGHSGGNSIAPQQAPPPPPQASMQSPAPAPAASTSDIPQSVADSKIKHKQQRLLLLRHASKCQAKDGECTKTPHCAEMKRLWAHISGCQDKNCSYPHCLSSRYVLMHYRRCKDAQCPACAPVRGQINNKENETKAKDGFDEVPADNNTEPPQNAPKRIKTDDGAINAEVKKSSSKPPTPQPQGKSEDLSYSIVNNFTISQIELHLQSLTQTYLLPQKTIKEKCNFVLKVLQEHQYHWIFAKPVDPVELGLTDYFDVIKKPMDLGTVQKKLESGHYHSLDDFHCDVCLTFDNALTYNEDGSVVNEMAKEMKSLYLAKYDEIHESLRKEEEERKQNERACPLCGFEKLQFEPPVFFCSNEKCSSKRIHRNRHFYVGGNNECNYCTQCYNELDKDSPIILPGSTTLMKTDLKKRKNDEVHEENWVQCDVCQRWIHQICGLFNSRQNKDNGTYSCPKCLLDERKKGKPPEKGCAPSSQELPRTKLSEFIENYLEPKVKAQYKVLARDQAEVEKISFEEAHQRLLNSGKITIRQVTSMDKRLEVRDKMRSRYAHKNYPEAFPYRCKCLLVFQNLDGADVVLFALYVYEHGADNPPPNHRTVYISYLDSVHFMRPRKLRTFVYHEILIAYLEYARLAGFAKAHIWACPPFKGDDYIFYAKPEDQKTPKEKMLTKWYIDMLTEGQKRGIIGKLTNMYDLYIAPGNLDATAVPYIEGDYFAGEMENLIKELEEGKGSKSSSAKKKDKKKKGNDKSKSKNGRKGTRSAGLDDATVGLMDGNNSSSGVTRDPIMVKLGEKIRDMKNTFIVAYLNWDGAKPEDKEVPPNILEERQRRKLLQEDAENESKKRDANGNVKSEKQRSANIINDDTDEVQFEIFDSRTEFLNLCKGNHYQFDTPRRAKHTSMMVLWHLHNKNAAKFVSTCMNCSNEILSGVRYTCNDCSDVDLCADCYKLPNANRGLCTHQLVCKSVEADSGQSSAGSRAAAKKRKKSILLHIKLLEHSSLCNSPNCSSANCAKMKQYMRHVQQCKQKFAGGCRICKRIWTLIRYHASKCKNNNCPIPNCQTLRERMRQLQLAQQAMDDRRRQAMNRQFRGNDSG